MQTLVAILLGIFCWSIALRRRKSLKVPLPPSPPSDPILGHLRYVPPENPELQYAEWAKTYGDVIYLRILNRPIIILNSVEAATDLLEKRGENYSDRPAVQIFDIMGWKNNIAFMNHGKEFQRQRKLFQEYFGRNKVGGYAELQVAQARQLAVRLAKGAEDREHILESFASGVIVRIAYGHDMFCETDDTYDDLIRDVSYSVSHCGPIGGTPVDLFPILRYFPSWFPGAYYAGVAREFRSSTEKLYDYPFTKVQRQLREGTALPSFLSYHLEHLKDDESHKEIKAAAAAMFAAGSETTWSTLSVFMLAMVAHPECQERAQKELDSLLHSSRLPDMKDRQSLPYIECVLQETFRWLSVVPLGIPHCVLNDDVYKNMFIPKGAIVFANIWNILRDERVYHDPTTFNPSRYLPKSEGGNEEPFPGGSQFGYGRRICPGRYLADASLWIAIATILALFRIERAKNEMGEDIIPVVAISTGLASHPEPYESKIQLRDANAKALLEEAEAELKNNHQQPSL